MSESQTSTVFAMVHNSTSGEVAKRWKEIIDSICRLILLKFLILLI